MADELPLEIIEEILGYLRPSDRKVAAVTCHLWYEASLVPNLWKDMVLTVEHSMDEVAKVLKTTRKPIQHAKLTDINLTSCDSEVFRSWNQFSPCLYSLEIEKSFVTEANLLNLLIPCQSLESLHFHDCRDTFIVGKLFTNDLVLNQVRLAVPNLRELCFADNASYLSDALVDRLMSLISKLKYLSFTGTAVSFHPGIHTRFYPETLCKEGSKSSELVLTFDCILGHISNHSRTLKYLDFSRTLMNDKACIALSKVEGLQLRSLLLRSCEISHTGIAALCAAQPTIKELDVSSCARITDTALASICNELPNLENLSLQNCRALTDTGISVLNKLSRLQCLDIQGAERVTSAGILQGLLLGPNKTLRSINLGGTRITEEALLQLAKNAPMLTNLDLTSCIKAVNDSTLRVIWSSLRWLRKLRLDWCVSITDAGFAQLDTANAPSRDGDFASQKDNGQQIPKTELVRTSCVSSLTGLVYLSLTGCNKITDSSLHLAFAFKELNHIDLNSCSKITDDGVAALCEQNPGLEVLVLNYCNQMSDLGIAKSLAFLHRIRRLELYACSKLTNATLATIELYRLQYLNFLDISHCNQMSLKRADQLQNGMPSIRELRTAGLD